jgi:biotin carboxyl carrier protein
MPLLTKTALSLLGTVISLGSISLSVQRRPQSETPAASAPQHLAGAYTTVAATAPESGHVDAVFARAGSYVATGQVLARLSVPFCPPAVRQEQQAVHQAEAAYQQHPTPKGEEDLRQRRAHLAAAPRFVRDGYVVAPVAGYLAKNLVVAGEYVPRKGTVALIEVPAVNKPEPKN